VVRFTVGFYFNYTGLSRGRPFGPLAHPFAEIALISPEWRGQVKALGIVLKAGEAWID
jgi:hypothetical protein